MQILSHHAPPPSFTPPLSTQQGDKRSVDVAPSEAFGDTNPMMGPVDVPRWGEERDRRARTSAVRGCYAIAGWPLFRKYQFLVVIMKKNEITQMHSQSLSRILYLFLFL